MASFYTDGDDLGQRENWFCKKKREYVIKYAPENYKWADIDEQFMHSNKRVGRLYVCRLIDIMMGRCCFVIIVTVFSVNRRNY